VERTRASSAEIARLEKLADEGWRMQSARRVAMRGARKLLLLACKAQAWAVSEAGRRAREVARVDDSPYLTLLPKQGAAHDPTAGTHGAAAFTRARAFCRKKADYTSYSRASRHDVQAGAGRCATAETRLIPFSGAEFTAFDRTVSPDLRARTDKRRKGPT